MSYQWTPSSAYSSLPGDAVYVGRDVDQAPIYVGRAFHEGDFIPAKVIPAKNVAYIAFGGEEHAKYQYDVLCGQGFDWVVSGNGHVPADAVCSGNQSNGEPLYVGRVHHEGSLLVGKVHPSHGCIYVPFGGQEHRHDQYEVLVKKSHPQWIQVSRGAPLPHGAILAGHDQDRSPIYIGRAYFEGDLLPAKVIPSKDAVYVPYNCQEHPIHTSYDVLCNGNIDWVAASYGNIPPNAVVAGNTASGERLFVGRAHHEGSLTVGKVHPAHGCLYIPFGGREERHDHFEVLIEK